MGISLWIVPNATDARRLENIMHIKQLGSSSAQGASYPKFHPHITLASLPLSVESNLADVEASITNSKAPLTVKLSSVEIGPHYFRSVYIAIEPTSQIMELHGRIHEALQTVPRTPSFPHLSLYYIDDRDAAVGERNASYKALEDRGKIRARGEGGICLDCGILEEDWMDCFEANEIWVVRCEGPVNEWAVLKKLPIQVTT